VPDGGGSVRLDAADVAFDPDRYEDAAAPTAPTSVAVSATVAATPETGTVATELAGLLTARLTALVSSIGAGSVIDANAVLDALRDDAHYQLDALTLQVRFTLGDTFVEVAPGGAAFTAQAGQTFTVAGVTVK